MELSLTTPIKNWELLWATYNEPTYQDVRVHIGPNDNVLEIGAGDFHLTERMARQARSVYAIEINAKLAAFARNANQMDNLKIVCGDAYQHPFPPGIGLAVLLMRHCQQFKVIVDKLTAIGCHRLLTNARWGLGVEMWDLGADTIPYEMVPIA